MYDTVFFWLDVSLIGDNPFIIEQYLSEPTKHENKKKGYYISGKVGDYSVEINNSGLYLHGSLAKYYLPSNVFTLTRQTAKQAIEKLSDELHVDIKKARVTRADVSTVIQTLNHPSDYYCYLGNKPYFERVLATNDTLYYDTKKRQLIFYDKIKDALAKNAIIPENLANTNLLRYELRYRKELKRQLKTNSIVTGALLTDSNFYYPIIQNWKNEFDSISKINSNIPMIENIETPKEAQNALFAILLQEKGQERINEYMALLKANKIFNDPKSYSRVKSSLNNLIKTPYGQKHELIKELEQSIYSIAKYAQ